MLKKCDLSFKENAILTKEMLGQMNHEPKWLLLDFTSEIKCGIISGFEFVNGGIDNQSIITKGNMIIDGTWYRLDEDYVLNGDVLESGKQYDIILVPNGEDFEFVLSESGDQREGIRFAGFKYEFAEHKRVFRVPEVLSDFRRGEAFIKEVEIPYYNYYGICVCPKHIANCIKESLARKSSRTMQEEIIYQNLMNFGNISVESLCDLVDIAKEERVTISLIEQLIRQIGTYRKKEKEETEDVTVIAEESKTKSISSAKRSRRLGQRGDNT